MWDEFRYNCAWNQESCAKRSHTLETGASVGLSGTILFTDRSVAWVVCSGAHVILIFI